MMLAFLLLTFATLVNAAPIVMVDSVPGQSLNTEHSASSPVESVPGQSLTTEPSSSSPVDSGSGQSLTTERSASSPDCPALSLVLQSLNVPLGLSESACCQWSGITCKSRSKTRRVTKIELSKRTLDGTIANELLQLTELQIFKASSSGLVGTLPGQLGSLTALQEVDVSRSSIS